MSTETDPFAAENPYAPPLDPFASGGGQGIFRQGKYLVIHKGAELPDRCVKSNEPTDQRLRRKLSWHHPAVYVALLANILLYVVLALLIRKTGDIRIGLAERFIRRRRRNMLIAWMLVLGGIVAFVVGLANAGGPQVSWLLVFGVVLGPLAVISGGLLGLFGCRVVYPKRITDEHIWLGGVCPEFLAEYEECRL